MSDEKRLAIRNIAKGFALACNYTEAEWELGTDPDLVRFWIAARVLADHSGVCA